MTRNIYYDTEFLEGTQKKRFLGVSYGNTKNTVDLISIGMVDDEGNKYYAISKDFNLREAWNRYDMREASPAKKYMGFYEEKVYWIRENVLKPIYEDLFFKAGIDKGFPVSSAVFNGSGFTYKNLKLLLDKYGKSNKQIAEEVKNFVLLKNGNSKVPKVNLYAYYSSFDHVALAWLYGKMIDLPKGFPMYTTDLKQELDRVNEYELKRGGILGKLEDHPAFPKNENAHSAIEDAVWNKELHEFLKQLN